MAYLAAHGHEPVPTDAVGSPNMGSVTDKSFVSDVLGRLDFESVIHLAGIADLKKTMENPHLAFEVNCYGTLNMLELALKKGVRRFVYASSANVYGAPTQNPVTEETPFDPRVPYDYSKVAGESFVWGYHKAKNLPVSVTRSWLLFGEGDILAGSPQVHKVLHRQPADQALQLREGYHRALPCDELWKARDEPHRERLCYRTSVQLRGGEGAQHTRIGRAYQDTDRLTL